MVASSAPTRQFRNRLNAVRMRALAIFWWLAPRGVLRVLPGTSRSFGPPRRAETWQSYRRRNGTDWREVFPESPRENPAPFFCNDSRAAFLQPTAKVARWPSVGVASIPNGRILDEHGWAVGDDDTLLGDFCLWGIARESRANHTLKLHAPRRLTGRTLNLCSAEAMVNFYHYSLEAVGRYALVRRAGFAWSDFDQVVMPRYRTATTAEIDRLIGVPREKIIRMARREQFVCDLLIQPSFPGTLAGTPPWIVDFYRELFPARPPLRLDRKLYFPRYGRRRPCNADAIDERLAALGFEVVDPGKTPDLRDLLAEASHVVGVHGAGLTNLVFCRPGTRVLEILPSDNAYHHNAFYYYTLCASGGMPYGAVVGKSLRHRLLPVFPQSGADFQLDPAAVERGIAALLAV